MASLGRTAPAPAVSIIIPTYDCSGPLRLALETVALQELRDFEVLVIGDGCTDDTGSVVRAFAQELGEGRLRWRNLPSNSGGPSVPRNEALRLARGRYVAYLGHDDLWFPWHLAELVDRMEADGSDLAYSLGLLLGPDGILGPLTLPDEPWDARAGISPSNWLHRAGLAEAVGGWSPRAKLGDDRDFLRRVLESGARICFEPRLSVLKFPAIAWRMYALEGRFPQRPYVEALRRDAVGLASELSARLEERASGTEDAAVVRRSGGVLRRTANRVLDSYGYHRWPVNHLLQARWRRRSGLGRRGRPRG